MDKLNPIEKEKLLKQIEVCLKIRQVKDCTYCCRCNRCEDYLLIKNKKNKKNN